MKSVLWILVHIAAATVLAVRILRDFRKTVDETPENRESTQEGQLPDALNDDHGKP